MVIAAGRAAPAVLQAVRRVVAAAVSVVLLSGLATGCSGVLDDALGPSERVAPTLYQAAREEPADAIGLYFAALSGGAADVVCELTSASTDSAALLRSCVSYQLGCSLTAEEKARLGAVRVNRAVLAELAVPTPGGLVAVPYRALTWPKGEVWPHQGGDGPDGIALYLRYDDGWRLDPYGYLLPACGG